jgi:hypothetical protein
MTLPDKITVELSRAEALVLFEYLRRCDDDGGQYAFIDQAEQRAVWNLECVVQRQLPEIFASNSASFVPAASKGSMF